MADKRFWCLDEYKGETSPIVDGKYAPTNGWLCNKLNELYEENEQSKMMIATLRNIVLENENLEQKNKELKYKYDEQSNEKMGLEESIEELLKENKELQERNNRQAKQLGNIYHLIEKQDWKTLKGIIEEFKECEEQLQKEWRTYGDVE